MSRNRFWWSVIALLVVASMALVACGKATPTPAPAKPTEAPAKPTEAPKPTPTPTPVPHFGAWVDQVVFQAIESDEQALPRLEAGEIDLYGHSMSNPEAFAKVKENPDLSYVLNYGVYVELTFNPVLNFADGRLNPFGDPQIREAMNWAVDRDYIVQEIYGGLATPKYLPITSAFPDYARYVDKVREIEAKYAYDLEKAREVITAEMEAMGAELVDGKWTHNGEPITLVFLIRVEDERKQIGDYVANQLEALGFTVDRQYKTSKEAAPLWLFGDPADGQWNVYTGGWITTAVDRDQGGNFAFFYTDMGIGVPLWQAYKNTPEFYDVAKKLANNQFANMDERGQLFRQAMELAVQDSVRVWIADTVGFTPFRSNLEVAYDLAGGIEGSALWPFTLRFKGEEGGTVRWGQPQVLVQPWNPLGGSDWIYDTDVQRGTGEFAIVTNPYTGLGIPNRVEKAEVVAKKGLPIAKTLDWVSLDFADEIQVPGDAWVDWDAEAQKFITADEMNAKIEQAKADMDALKAQAAEAAGGVDFGAFDAAALQQFLSDFAAAAGYEVDVAAAFEGEEAQAALQSKVEEITGADDPAGALATYAVEFLQEQVPAVAAMADMAGRDPYATANVKSVVYYEPDLFQKVKWHDGSPLTMGDFIMNMILTFDRAKEASAIYDPAIVPDFQSFMEVFKGVRIVSTDPLIIETYSDSYSLDAENNVSSWWPYYDYGQAPWHTLAVGYLAEANGELAFSSDKSEEKGVEWMNFISGPSLEILKKYLDQAMADGFIPYQETLGQYVTADEAKARYENLAKWYEQYGHFWVGTGPFFLSKVDTTAQTVVLERNPDYPDTSDKWAGFGEPKMATVEVDGPGQVVKGQEVTFDVYVTFAGEPYPADEIAGVAYLVFDDAGNLLAKGDAALVEDGHYQVVLTGDVTGGFAEGAARLEIAVTSKLVSIPGFGSADFVVAAP